MNTDVSAMVVMTVLFLVAYAWISLIARVVRGREILAFEARRPVPWGLIAVGVSFFLLIASQIAAGATFVVPPDAEPTVAQTGELLTWTAIAIMVATFISIGSIHLLTRAGLGDFGISLDLIPRDLLIGVYAFFILAPITFAIQYVFVSVFGLESHHPLIELLKQDTTGKLFGVVTVLAVVVAPISEEYFFRVLLQGWLERIVHRQDVAGFAQAVVAPTGEEASQGSVEVTTPVDANRYSLPPLTDAEDHSAAAAAAITPTSSVAPIVISAAVFALMHWSHGPDPAALFVLALGLGYLYQRTHRWLPSVVTHACLNGTTMLLLWFGLDQLPS